jgi:hypothetical protein
MSDRPEVRRRWGLRLAPALMLALVLAPATALRAMPPPPPGVGPLTGLDLPDTWEARFWADPAVKAMLDRDAAAVAAMVPKQAGFRHARCPSCGASERDDPLRWSPATPDKLACRACGGTFPNETIPAKVPPGPNLPPAVPEEAIEVRTGVVHRYPYHAVEAGKAQYPDERVYLAAKRDYEAREFLAKLALYAAVRYREAPPEPAVDPALARLAATLLVRFAQVYPDYAVHRDQPGQAKTLQPAAVRPPYRRAFETAKWDWTGALDVPLNLVIAYALLRDDPALAASGAALGEPDPRRAIEERFLRPAATFVRDQPADLSELSLYACRGMLAVGRLLDDPGLVDEAVLRLQRFARRGFSHDGLWCQGDPNAHRRILNLLDGWVARLLGEGQGEGEGPPGADAPSALDRVLPQLAVARAAGDAPLTAPVAPEILQAAWPAPAARAPTRRPALLGGSGLVRLAVGSGPDAMDLELRGLADPDGLRSNRLALRLAVAGRPVLGDLDDLPPAPDGLDRATSSHNAVLVDGLNQRETLDGLRRPAPPSSLLFFAADPDLQVAAMEDRQAYPRSAARYRQVVALCAGPRTRYGVSIVDVEGGLQHDQLHHAAPGVAARWGAAVPLATGPDSLLPPALRYLTTARAEDGRWFVQSLGAVDRLASARLDGPTNAWLDVAEGPGVRLHLLADLPADLHAGRSPVPGGGARGTLVLRRRSAEGGTLSSRFVTVYEPTGTTVPGLRRVGRVDGPPDAVVLLIQGADGDEHLAFNLRPGTERTLTLADGRSLVTDALAVRVDANGLTLAGGQFATLGDLTVRAERVAGRITGVGPEPDPGATTRSVFEVEAAIADPAAVAGRALLVRHGDGVARGWTVEYAELIDAEHARLHARELPGFHLDAQTGAAVYDQYPGTSHPGPHRFVIPGLSR